MITRYTSPFTLLFDFRELIALLGLSFELGSMVTLSSLLFEPHKFFAPLAKDLIPKPLKASIFSFPNEKLLVF